MKSVNRLTGALHRIRNGHNHWEHGAPALTLLSHHAILFVRRELLVERKLGSLFTAAITSASMFHKSEKKKLCKSDSEQQKLDVKMVVLASRTGLRSERAESGVWRQCEYV